jgi:hypothetical protein
MMSMWVEEVTVIDDEFALTENQLWVVVITFTSLRY